MRVVLGVSGCIAAYKAVEVLRGLQKGGADVRVVMTRHATEFVGKLTFQAISGHEVVTEMFAPTADPEIKHIEIAQAADLLLVAPATANVLAKFANGIADDFLSTLYISTTAPVMVAPAMNVEMWAHPATRENVRRLRERGVQFIDPGEGYLACRTVGAGRLAEPSEIVDRAFAVLTSKPAPSVEQATAPLNGEHVLITAGPTYEAIDPVRGITNRSSGKMGYALAESAAAMGATVTLITGPVALTPPSGVRTIRVRSAAEMLDATLANLDAATVVVMAAAVADYRPVQAAGQKIKKADRALTLELEPTADILATVGKIKGARVLIGFAAETENVVANALKKLQSKKADLMIANDVSASDAGFEVDTNRVTLVSALESRELPLLNKREVADRILEAALNLKALRLPVSG
ncbi:MAG TPA: bifunctional phosphopantothenoylcysteine decarboxylase/phosphopantothenate--cysteine ligase CoaBC [Blastocatellia bacterium]